MSDNNAIVHSVSKSPADAISISAEQFSAVFKEDLTPFLKSKIESYDFKYFPLSQAEKDECVRETVEALVRKELERAGEHRRNQWENGWGENRDALEANQKAEAIIPKYFEKIHTVRWKQEWIKPASAQFEYRMLAVIQNWLFDKYLRDVDAIYEFGCGTGHNLFRMQEVNSHAKITGLDWAKSSQEIIRKLSEDGILKNVEGHCFDYFNPDYSFDLERNSAVVTVASLEQVGNRFGAFVDYLLKKKPGLCIHIEPIAELLDENHLMDFLSIEYFKKRNYLSGFLTELRRLEGEGRLKIFKAQRTFIGSFFIDGYSVVVWAPTQEA